MKKYILVFFLILLPVISLAMGPVGGGPISGGGGGGSSGGGTWGSITGTLSNQTDLNTALSGKQAIPTNITYSNLATLIGSSSLVPGQKYKITDFATVHYIVDFDLIQHSDIITGVNEPLVVTATSSSTLDKVAFSPLYPQDVIYYDWNPANWLEDLSFGTGADTTPTPATGIIPGWKGVIYFRHDTLLDNYMGYDFRNVKFRRWKVATGINAPGAATAALVTTASGNLSNGAYTYLITFVNGGKETNGGVVSNSVTVDSAHKQIGLTAIPLGPSGTTARNIYRTTAGGSTYQFLQAISDNTTTSLTDNTADASLQSTNPPQYNLTGVPPWDGTVSYFIGNFCLVSSGSNPGVYRAIKAGTNQQPDIVDGNGSLNSIYWVRQLDFTITQYWCGSPDGVKRDYTIIIPAGTDYQDFLTFVEGTGSGTYELSVRSNHFGSFKDNNNYWDSSGSILSNNVFFIGDDPQYYSIFSNQTGAEFYFNTIGNYFYSNTIRNGFYSNTIGNHFNSNTIGNGFNSNTIGNHFNSNTIENYFYSNTIGNHFNSNTIGNDFGAYQSGNTVGDSFQNNKGGTNMNGIDFSSATNVYQTYTKELFIDSAGNFKLWYIDNSGVFTVANANN